MTGHYVKRIAELLIKYGNNKCGDCGDENPDYGAFNLGVLLCTTCAAFHQKIGAHVSKVKSLKLAKWNDDQIQELDAIGNIEANKKYEKHIPVYYRKPVPNDPIVLVEQFIRAKYERLEFIHVDKQKYNKDSLEESLLVKRRKDDSNYVAKLFVLAKENNLLSIFSKEDSKEAKISIPLSRLNISLAPLKTNLETSMQLTFVDDGVTRHLFVSHASGEVLIDWYMGIRHAKLLTLMRAYPTEDYTQLLPYLTNDFAMEGWLSKTGPNENDAYRKRWVTLDNRKLMYHMNPLDELPRGEFFIGDGNEGYEIKEGACVGGKEMGFAFSLVTPDRTFVFSVSSSAERNKWMKVIQKVIEKEIQPHDIHNRILLDPTKKRASRHSWFHF